MGPTMPVGPHILGLNLAKITRGGCSEPVRLDPVTRRQCCRSSFAADVVRERGHISKADVQAVRDAGFSRRSDRGNPRRHGWNVFTNLLNVVAETEIDFPVLHTGEAA